jgi:hypothetical protein
VTEAGSATSAAAGSSVRSPGSIRERIKPGARNHILVYTRIDALRARFGEPAPVPLRRGCRLGSDVCRGAGGRPRVLRFDRRVGSRRECRRR